MSDSSHTQRLVDLMAVTITMLGPDVAAEWVEEGFRAALIAKGLDPDATRLNCGTVPREATTGPGAQDNDKQARDRPEVPTSTTPTE